MVVAPVEGAEAVERRGRTHASDERVSARLLHVRVLPVRGAVVGVVCIWKVLEMEDSRIAC